MAKAALGVRYAEILRETTETRIQVVLDLDGGTRRDITTGVGFFDHMLQQLAFHGQMDLGIQVEGDLEIDDHHTVEDVGIVLGKAVRQALEGDEAIVRYADCHTAMDDSLVLVALDLGGRAFLVWDVEFTRESLGALATENVREFFRAFTSYAGITLHVKTIAGCNDHHLCEAIFKGVGRVLHQATRPTDRRAATTKGKRD